MIVLIIAVIILVSFLLVLVILAQNPKGGLSSQFGGSGTSNLIGVKKTGDLLENITWTLVIALFALTLSMNFVTDDTPQGYISPNVERAQERSTVPFIDLDTESPAPVEDQTPTTDDSEENLDALTDEDQ